MASWTDLTGQRDAIELLQAASDPVEPKGLTHAWLITGPPGSGRSTLAYAFAAALLSREPGGDDVTRKQVEARTHPDLSALSTDRVIITIDEVRDLVRNAYRAPSVARFRVMVVEDADRMTERTSNLLLKSLEEPPSSTIWVLCAPSEADLLPTIRSRVRSVRLGVPTIDDVAELLERRDGVAHDIAERAAREAQSHVGMAHRLATDPGARQRRESTLRAVLDIRSAGQAVVTAGRLLELAGDDAKAYTSLRDEAERESTLRSLGVEPGQSVPPALRSQVRAMEEDQKRRATRSLRDGLDRIMVDLLSLYRDIVLLQLGHDATIINRELRPELEDAARRTTPAVTIDTLEAISVARTRIEGNVAPALALEAMLVSAVR
jgi:DNA polymerase-3 subunit delta'